MNKKWLILGTISFSVGLSLNLVINRDIKQAALTGLLSLPATVAGVYVTEHQRKQKLNNKISKQQGQLQGLVQQEASFNNSIALLSEQVENLKQQEENIKVVIESLNVDHQQHLQLAARSQSELETIQNQIYELSNRKSSLEPEIITLEVKLRQLRKQERALSKLLADLSNSQQQKGDLIQKQIVNQENQKIQLNDELSQLKIEIIELQKSKLKIKLELENLQKQIVNEETSLSQKPQSTSNLDWQDSFKDANIKQVFLHLDRHNSLTEAELNQMLGSPRQTRRFAGNLEQYLTQVPFSVRVETTSNGKRYVKY